MQLFRSRAGLPLVLLVVGLSRCHKPQTLRQALVRMCDEVRTCAGCDGDPHLAWNKVGAMVEQSRPPATSGPVTNPEGIILYGSVSGAPAVDRLRVFREALAEDNIEDCALIPWIEREVAAESKPENSNQIGP